jgi:hypothetical protein
MLSAQRKTLLAVQTQLDGIAQKLEEAPAQASVVKPPTELELAMPQQVRDLTQRQEQMRTVMTMLGTVLAVALAGKPAGELTAAHAVMDGIIANIENVFNWDDASKRMVYETMKTHKPFQDAIKRLDDPPTPRRTFLH